MTDIEDIAKKATDALENIDNEVEEIFGAAEEFFKKQRRKLETVTQRFAKEGIAIPLQIQASLSDDVSSVIDNIISSFTISFSNPSDSEGLDSEGATGDSDSADSDGSGITT